MAEVIKFEEIPFEVGREDAPVLGEGGYEDFGSGMVAEAVEVQDEQTSAEKLERGLDREQAKKRGNMMRQLTETLKRNEAVAKRRELNSKIGRFGAYRMARLEELNRVA